MTTNYPCIYELGNAFYDNVKPAMFPKHILRYRNNLAANAISLEQLSDKEWIQHFAEFKPIKNNIQEPLALRYHGHQFTHYNPDLGDGRGFLFAQFQTDNGKVLDLGTKGSGQTPYSRAGDGRLTLKGAYREILATEYLKSQGVNTSHTFSVVETGESLERNDEPSPTRSAVLVRLCHSHIRFGTFQRLAYLKQSENIKTLISYCLKHYYPEITAQDPIEAAAHFYREVCRRSADMVASWMMTGFVHGVMNTDNMNITGECFDYGPYRFLPKYNPQFTAAYFDHQGLYCFGRQPITMVWNLERLAESLNVAYPEIPYSEILENYGDDFNLSVKKYFLQRLNLKERNNTEELLAVFFQFLEKEQPLYEQTFFDLHSGVNHEQAKQRLQNSIQKEIYQTESFMALEKVLKNFEIDNFAITQKKYFQKDKPCTLLIDEIESIWKNIAENDDWSLFDQKLLEIRSMSE